MKKVAVCNNIGENNDLGDGSEVVMLQVAGGGQKDFDFFAIDGHDERSW